MREYSKSYIGNQFNYKNDSNNNVSGRGCLKTYLLLIFHPFIRGGEPCMMPIFYDGFDEVDFATGQRANQQYLKKQAASTTGTTTTTPLSKLFTMKLGINTSGGEKPDTTTTTTPPSKPISYYLS